MRLLSNTLVVLLAISVTAAKADDLFSEVTIDSVFGTAKSSISGGTTSAAPAGGGKRIAGASSLRKTLQNAGFATQDFDSKSVLATVNAPRTKEKKLSAFFSVDVDKGRVVIGIPLVQIDEKSISAQKLLEMMNSSRNADAIYFAYSPDTKWLGIRRTISNAAVTTASIRQKIEEMVAFAENSTETWESEGTSLETKPTPQKVATGPKQAPKKTFSLTGLWGATGTRGEGYGIKFDDAKFELAISQNGKTSESKGSYAFSDGKLTLDGDGITLSGKLVFKSVNRFELRLDNGTNLTFTKD